MAVTRMTRMLVGLRRPSAPNCRAPVLPPDFVERPRLVEQLRLGIGRKLTLVCAPAGFGKTTLLVPGGSTATAGPSPGSRWTPTTATCWSSCNRCSARWTRSAPGGCRDTNGLLNAAAEVALSQLGTALADDLARIDTDIVIILDDYHLIQEQSIHVLLSTVLRPLPANVQFVVTSRESPPLPSAALRPSRTCGDQCE